jgi:hypothetical protein
MALKGTSTDPIRPVNMFGWAIRMQDERGKNVRIIVSDDALQDIARRQCGVDVESIAQRSNIIRLAVAGGTNARIAGARPSARFAGTPS